jgi:hypothetical protein
MRADLPAALGRLRDDLRAVRLDLAVPGAEEARRTRDDLVAQVDDYLLPRPAQMDAPALIVVGGSTGAGKAARSLRTRVEDVGNELVVAPVEAELDVERRLCEAVASARRGRRGR